MLYTQLGTSARFVLLLVLAIVLDCVLDWTDTPTTNINLARQTHCYTAILQNSARIIVWNGDKPKRCNKWNVDINLWLCVCVMRCCNQFRWHSANYIKTMKAKLGGAQSICMKTIFENTALELLKHISPAWEESILQIETWSSVLSTNSIVGTATLHVLCSCMWSWLFCAPCAFCTIWLWLWLACSAQECSLREHSLGHQSPQDRVKTWVKCPFMESEISRCAAVPSSNPRGNSEIKI